MPAKSKAQFRLMKAVEHNPKLAKRTGISQDVAAEYTSSNVGKKSYSKLPDKMASGGLYENINAKRERIAKGSGEKMRKPGTAGAPTEKAFRFREDREDGQGWRCIAVGRKRRKNARRARRGVDGEGQSKV